MTPALALDWMQLMLWTAVRTGAPVILSVVVVGLIISIGQAATQVNDAAVGFAPKLLVVLATMIIAGEWMLLQLRDFAAHAIESIATLGPG
jgi:flagellar biosynthetic protein FliQ